MSDLFFSIDRLDRLHRQMASVFAGFPASLRAMRNLSSRQPAQHRRARQDRRVRAGASPGIDRCLD
ncbi:hypothetical protein BZM27_44800 [Paraburkholderia steynii]|uniref:Uncharacterized protein n=1 Tax=Paraburkholderia steynii TaxID=1245441 RepID=A0A4R0X253_9BURK|nr:hypothetical protein BZM27_44800 [Paraburkholderia steynii]